MEKVCNSRQTLSSHLAKRKFTFSSSSFLAFQLTKIVILLRNHIYMFLLLAGGGGEGDFVGMADFLNNSFISFYDVHVVQEFTSCSLVLSRSTAYVLRHGKK